MILGIGWSEVCIIAINISIIGIAFQYRSICKELNEINSNLMWINLRLKGHSHINVD
jgi:hypothetical protein